MKRLIALFLFSILLLPVPVSAQENKRLSREAIDSIKNRRLFGDGRSVLYFETYTHDMGTMRESDTVRTVTFPFANVSKESVTITDITVNCGCTSSSCDKSIVAPGEKGVVTVKFNPRRRSGTVDTNAFVYTSLSGNLPVAKLTLLGNVIDMDEWRHLPCVMGTLRLKSKEVVFEQVKRGTRPQMRIMCANVGERPLRLTSELLPQCMTLITEPAELAPGEEGDIVITIDGCMLPDNAGSLSILVDGVEGSVADRMINVRIKNIKE